nr:winged helix-turn-helix domain-containing protein [Streptomyces sp. NRRL S-237]
MSDRTGQLWERGPSAHGWVDQRWTLARIKTMIGRLFHVCHTVEGTWRLLKRYGWSRQQPTRRAIGRFDAAVEVWKVETWPRVKALWRSAAPGSTSRTRRDFRDLIVRARIQFGGPIVLVRDNIRLHARGGRSRPDHPGGETSAKQIQHRPDLVDGCLAGTGLSLDPARWRTRQRMPDR